MEYIDKEVYFHKYCPTCKYEKTSEVEEPCNECLEYGVNDYTHRPVKWKEKGSN